jgi:hypothetical protein
MVMTAAAAGSLFAARRMESSYKSKAIGALGVVLAAADVVGLAITAVDVDELDTENKWNIEVGRDMEKDLLKYHSPGELDEIWGNSQIYFGEGVVQNGNDWSALFNFQRSPIPMSAAATPAPGLYPRDR